MPYRRQLRADGVQLPAQRRRRRLAYPAAQGPMHAARHVIGRHLTR